MPDALAQDATGRTGGQDEHIRRHHWPDGDCKPWWNQQSERNPQVRPLCFCETPKRWIVSWYCLNDFNILNVKLPCDFFLNFQPADDAGMPRMRDYSHGCHHFHWWVWLGFFSHSPTAAAAAVLMIKTFSSFHGSIRVCKSVLHSSVVQLDLRSASHLAIKRLWNSDPPQLHSKTFETFHGAIGWMQGEIPGTDNTYCWRANLWCKLSSLNHIIVRQQL